MHVKRAYDAHEGPPRAPTETGTGTLFPKPVCRRYCYDRRRGGPPSYGIFLWLRDGTHPLAVGPVTPWPLAQARQIRPAAPVGATKPGARPTGRSQDNPSGIGRIGGQAGTQAPDATPAPPQNHASRAGSGEAGPEALSTSSLPNICLW